MHYAIMTTAHTNFDDELMMNKWAKKYYRLANQTGKSRTFQRGVLDRDCITMLCFKVVLQIVFFFFKLE